MSDEDAPKRVYVDITHTNLAREFRKRLTMLPYGVCAEPLCNRTCPADGMRLCAQCRAERTA